MIKNTHNKPTATCIYSLLYLAGAFLDLIFTHMGMISGKGEEANPLKPSEIFGIISISIEISWAIVAILLFHYGFKHINSSRNIFHQSYIHLFFAIGVLQIRYVGFVNNWLILNDKTGLLDVLRA